MEETTEQREIAGEVEEGQELGVEPEIIDRAVLYGWSPKEDFKGDPQKWVSADVFVKRAEEILPIAKSMNRKLETDLISTKAELAELKKTMKAIIKTHEKISQSTFDSAMRQLKKEQAEAVSEGDLEKWQSLEERREELSKQKPEEVKFEEAGVAGENPVVTQWKKDNKWYDTDPELGTYADSIATFISTRTPGLPPEEFLQKVKDEVRKRFPEKFGNLKRSNPPSVDRTELSGGDVGGGSKKTYSDLPPDAKAACNELIKQKVLTKEKYVKIYFEEE